MLENMISPILAFRYKYLYATLTMVLVLIFNTDIPNMALSADMARDLWQALSSFIGMAYSLWQLRQWKVAQKIHNCKKLLQISFSIFYFGFIFCSYFAYISAPGSGSTFFFMGIPVSIFGYAYTQKMYLDYVKIVEKEITDGYI